MKQETIATLLFLLIVIGVLVVFKRIAFPSPTIIEELAAETALWSFGVVFTNTIQGLLSLIGQVHSGKAVQPPQRVTVPVPNHLRALVYRVDPLILQVMFLVGAMFMWCCCLLLGSLAQHSTGVSAIYYICASYYCCGLAIAIGYVSLEVKA
ncbi:MAG: hypothetical protein U0637_07450 [Phycisphaerales bacterium]